MGRVSKTSTATWQKALILYAQGVRPKEIAKRLGITESAIWSRASKSNWKALREGSEADQKEALERVIQTANFRFRSAMAKRLELLAASLPEEAQSPAKELQMQADLEPAVRNAKTVLGWTEAGGSSGSLVRVNVLGSVTIGADPPPPPTPVSPSALVGQDNSLSEKNS